MITAIETVTALAPWETDTPLADDETAWEADPPPIEPPTTTVAEKLPTPPPTPKPPAKEIDPTTLLMSKINAFIIKKQMRIAKIFNILDDSGKGLPSREM